MGVAHLAFDLGPRGQRCHRVDDDHVERARADEHVGDLERLLARVGLRDEQLVDVDADRPGVHRIHRVLGVDVGADAAVALRLRDDVHGECGLARRLGPVDLDDPPSRQTADAEGEVEREGARGDGLDRHRPLLAHPHDGALAELLVDLGQRHVEGLLTIVPVAAHHRSLYLPVQSEFEGPSSTAPSAACAVTRTVRRGCDRVGRTAHRGAEVQLGGRLNERQQCSCEQSFDQGPSEFARLPPPGAVARPATAARSAAAASASIHRVDEQVEREPQRVRERVDHDRHDDRHPGESQHERQHRDVGRRRRRSRRPSSPRAPRT